MAVGDAYVFPRFLTPVLHVTQFFFPKTPTTFLTCFCRGERQKYAGKKSQLNRGSNSQPPGRESDTLSSGERGINPVAMNITVLLKEYWPTQRFEPGDLLFSSLLGYTLKYRVRKEQTRGP